MGVGNQKKCFSEFFCLVGFVVFFEGVISLKSFLWGGKEMTWRICFSLDPGIHVISPQKRSPLLSAPFFSDNPDLVTNEHE